MYSTFQINNLKAFKRWSETVSNDMLIHIANAAQFLQMKACSHCALAILAERCRDLPVNELRKTLHETADTDVEQRSSRWNHNL
jgi:glycerol-3-phosphate O-acyltransferase